MNANEWDRHHLWRFRARLIRVIDGDTAVLLADVGYGARYEVHVRVAGLNAPERFTAEGPAATERLIDALMIPVATAWPWPLRIVSKQRETVIEETRSFERFVADIYVFQSDGTLRDVKELLHG